MGRVSDFSSAKQFEGAGVHSAMIEELERTDLSGHLATEEDIRGGANIIGQSEVLIDDLDPDGARVERPVEAMLRPVETDRPVGRMEVARDDLDEGRLASPVVAHEADHVAGVHRQLDVMKRPDRAEILADSLELQNSCRLSFCPRVHQPSLLFNPLV